MPKKKSSQGPLAQASVEEQRIVIYDGEPLEGSDWHRLKIDRPRAGHGGSVRLESADAAIPHWRLWQWRDKKDKLRQGLEFIASGPVRCVVAVVSRPSRG